MFLFQLTQDCSVYMFPTLLFRSGLKSKHIQLFREMQPSLNLELRKSEWYLKCFLKY